MKTLGLVVMLVLLLVGCAPTQVALPAGVAAVMYANARADYATAKVLITQACKAGRIDPDACEAATAIDLRAKIYKDSIEAAMMNPQQPIDWAQVMKYSEEVAGLIIRLGLVP
jgi:hypothetical protein